MNDDDYDKLWTLANEVCKYVTFSMSDKVDEDGKQLVDADFILDAGVEFKRRFRVRKSAKNTFPGALAALKQHLRETEAAHKLKKRNAGATLSKKEVG